MRDSAIICIGCVRLKHRETHSSCHLASSGEDASTGHCGKLVEGGWVFPPLAALGKHLQHRRDQFRSIQAAESHKDSAGETVQIVGKQASAAVRTEVAIEALAGFSDIVERLRLAAEEREIIFRHAKESRRRATGGLFAVVAMTGGDKSRICIELELHCTTGALCRVLHAHVIHLTLRDKGLTISPSCSESRSEAWQSDQTRPGSGR